MTHFLTTPHHEIDCQCLCLRVLASRTHFGQGLERASQEIGNVQKTLEVLSIPMILFSNSVNTKTAIFRVKSDSHFLNAVKKLMLPICGITGKTAMFVLRGTVFHLCILTLSLCNNQPLSIIFFTGNCSMTKWKTFPLIKSLIEKPD